MKLGNISEFSLTISVGISEYRDALFSFNSLISVTVYLRLTSLKLKIPFLLHLVLIARMLFVFGIAFTVGSLTFSIIGSKSEYWEMLRFFTILPKKIVKNLSCSRSRHRRCSVRKGVLRNVTISAVPESLFNKVAGLRPATLLKKRLWHRCFPVNFAKFLRTRFLHNTSGRLLLLFLISFHNFTIFTQIYPFSGIELYG